MKTIFSAAILMLLTLGVLPAQVIVANSSVRIAEISKSDLFDIFTGASSNFKDGQHAVPVTLRGGSVHEAFLKGYIGKKESLFRGGWRGVVFAGQGNMPEAFDSEEALLKYVASVAGAIGYIGETVDREKVKVVAVK